ncbi:MULTISPECIES: 2-dehydropantoate 2-reductase [unclassified Roseateles]|uniref:2-dehydropantoate 2-reductase n=1 Tax=unclassified Roseateles TaxID=2626991 RepID=UPI0006F4864E|nr:MULTISPECIES: 2-dehydropantoate 2-reductase [unclassified Roseateles]KQW42251.1 2-dehydropantoate 2-reductase [Pelomonas sp. Root405]KRA68124.1 2-dehydropantoate 2-reductase [Pelomonas sp. Root662]
MTQIAVVGPGAIGCTVATWLAQGPRHVLTLQGRSDLGTLEAETPQGLLRASPRVVRDAAGLLGVEWVLIAVKAYDAPTVAASLAPLFAGQAFFAVLQNGVEHLEHFQAHLPLDRMLPVMVDIPAERTAPGRVRQRRTGRMVVPAGELGARFVDLFSHTPLDVTQAVDFKSEIWKKLCLNAAGALSAVVKRPSVISRHAGVAALTAALIREVIAVGRAEGAVLPDSLVETILAAQQASPDAVNSMLADRCAGRPMEVDARNGVVVRLGRRHGIPTPINAMVTALLEASTLDADAPPRG